MNRILLIICIISLCISANASAVDPHPDWTNALKPKGKPGQEITLAQDGKTAYRIVIPAQPTTQETKAATDLAQYLKEITGADFSIVNEDASFRPTGKVISVGRTKLLDSASLPQASADLGDEGYAIAQKGTTLFLFGGRLRGPIYAVYSLLEEDLGCRWYTPNTSAIPNMPTLKFRPVTRTFIPALDRREPFYYDSFDANWSLRNKTNIHCVGLPKDWGGFPQFAYHFVHSFNIIMPPDEFFQDHPEYFAEVNGNRQPSQLCMTNQDVLRIFTERVLAKLRACPTCRYVDVSPNDWRAYCECKDCKAIDDSEGSQIASLLQFVNKVADAVAKERPGTRVTTLAYLGTINPPKTIRPHDNVQIVLCSDAHAWDFPYLTINDTITFQAALKAWSKLDVDLMIWDYAYIYRQFMQPTPNFDVTNRNMDILLANGAKGIFMQGGNRGIDRGPLRAWVIAKRMWDISTDPNALVRDFYYGYYGLAAEPLYEYDKTLSRAWEQSYKEWKQKHPGAVIPDQKEYKAIFYPRTNEFGPEFIDKADALFDRAYKLAEGNDELRRRIDYAYLSTMFLKADRGPGKDRQKYMLMIHDFERIARQNGVTQINEFESQPELDRYLATWRGLAQIDPEKSFVQPLKSEWQFKPDPQVVGIDEKWFASGLDDSNWGTVRSDLGHAGWEAQGYAEYEVGYGWYRQTVDLPADFATLPNLRLFFGAVDEQAEIWINGELALRHTSDVLSLSKDFLWNKPFIFDPAKYLKQGKNMIAVRVHNACLQGGIWKPVAFTWGDPIQDLHILEEFIVRQNSR